MSNTLYIAAAIAIGACLAVQPPINAVMSRILGNALLASSISIAISVVCVVVVWLIWSRGAGDFAQISELPWWVVIGGIVGVVFVAGSIVVAPVLGVSMFFVCVVAGQLLGSTIADQFGAFGMPVKPVNLIKLVGLGLVLAGAGLVQHSSR